MQPLTVKMGLLCLGMAEAGKLLSALDPMGEGRGLATNSTLETQEHC